MPSRLLLLLVATVAGAAELPAGVSFQRGADTLTLANDQVKLTFDPATGELAGYGPLDGRPVTGRGQSAVYRQDEPGWTPGDAQPKLVAAETAAADGAGLLRLTSTCNGWRWVEEWRLRPGSTLAVRQTSFTYEGTTEGEVGNARFVVSDVRLPGATDAELVLPMFFPVRRTPVAEFQPGRRTNLERGNTNNRLVVLRSAQQNRAVVALSCAGFDHGWANVEEAPGAVTIEHGFPTKLKQVPGATFGIRYQVLGLCAADVGAITTAATQAFALCGLNAAPDGPDGIDRAAVYSAHVGGTIGSSFRDVGGFKQFAAYLPHIRDLGFDTLWLLPFWEGPVYAPRDYFALDERLGTEADLKALCDQAHGLGLRVLGDLIPHGPRPESGFGEEHPDWVCQTHDGQRQIWWGCLGCDYAHPGWQGYMAKHATYWMDKVGLDGYRVDVAMGGQPNWNPYPGNWPSKSGAGGARELLATVRRAMKQTDKDSLLLMEGTAPWLFESGDIVYDFEWSMNLLRRSQDLGVTEWIPAAKDWLTWQRALFPKPNRLLRYCSSHDTTRGAWIYGPDLHRGLLALNILAEGVPMVYHDEDLGQGDQLRSLLKLRAELPALSVGVPDYHAATCDNPEVFAFTRRAADQVVLCAINLGPRKGANLRVKPGPGVPESWVNGLHVQLSPGEAVALLPGDSPRLASEPFVPKVGDVPQVRREGDRLIVGNELYQLTLDLQRGGQIEALRAGPEALIQQARFGEGNRKLVLGVPPMDLDAAPATVETSSENGVVTVVCRSMVGRLPGDQTNDALALSRTYRCEGRGAIDCSLELTPRRVAIERANAELELALTLGPDDWRVETLEGTLADNLDGARVDGREYPGHRYRHPVGAPLYSSRLLPLTGSIGSRAISIQRVNASPAEWLQDVRLTATVDADGRHPVVDIRWLDGRWPVTLRKGETATLSFRLQIGFPGAPPEPPGPQLHLDSGNYLVENDHYRCILGRSDGGKLRSLQLKQHGQLGPNLVADFFTYTDTGLYGDYKNPLGQEQRTNARSESDLEPDVQLTRAGGKLTVSFVGTVRNPYAGGRTVQHPYSWYRHDYTFDETGSIGLTLGFRPRGGFATVPTKAFVAHTFHLKDIRHWRAVGGDGAQEADTSATGVGRCWQSLAHGGLQPGGFSFETADGPVKLLPGEGADKYQNLFLLDPGGGRLIAFLALYDNQPVPIPATWSTSRWTLELP